MPAAAVVRTAAAVAVVVDLSTAFRDMGKAVGLYADVQGVRNNVLFRLRSLFHGVHLRKQKQGNYDCDDGGNAYHNRPLEQPRLVVVICAAVNVNDVVPDVSFAPVARK